jgi:hypothetical protein
MTKAKPKRVALDADGRVVLTPQLAETIWRLAWQPEGRQLMREALIAERGAPAPDGLRRALDRLRLMALEIAPQKNKGGRRALREKRAFIAWIMFQTALGKRRLVEPGFTKKAMMGEFVERSAAGKGFWHDGRRAAGHEGSKRLPSDAARLTSVDQLEKWLKVAERQVKGCREKTLRHYLMADVYAALRSAEQ